jgi:hypothetical protein
MGVSLYWIEGLDGSDGIGFIQLDIIVSDQYLYTIYTADTADTDQRIRSLGVARGSNIDYYNPEVL